MVKKTTISGSKTSITESAVTKTARKARATSNSGFDRGVDFRTMKKKLIKGFYEQLELFKKSKYTKSIGRSLIYILIEIIQLRNGCRITEAINAFEMFAKNGIEDLVEVKVCKSESKKKAWVLNKEKNIKELTDVITRARMRKIRFPIKWLNKTNDLAQFIKGLYDIFSHIFNRNLRGSICHFMLKKYNSNTHSLRYAFINYLIEVKKYDLALVAKSVSHSNTNQLVTYTQQKRADKILDLDI